MPSNLVVSPEGGPIVFTGTSTQNHWYTRTTSTTVGTWTTVVGSVLNVTGTTNCQIVSGGTYHVVTSSTAGNISSGYWVPMELTEDQKRERARWQKKAKLASALAVAKARSAIKRAVKLMDGLGFGSEIRVFLGGEFVEVSHPDSLLKFRLSKYRNSLVNRTLNPGISTPYELSLYTKSEIHVADLCVYLADTPVLDQVLAISMFIKTGDEERILTKANWRNLVRDMETREILALEYPYLKPKLRLNTQTVESEGYITLTEGSGFTVPCTIGRFVENGTNPVP